MREALVLPIVLGDGSSAATRNVSATGMYIEIDASARLEKWLSIEYVLPGIAVRFEAAGEVVRVQPGPRRTGIGIRLHSPRLAPVQ